MLSLGKNDVSVSDHTVLLSIHDVSPIYENHIIKTCDRLQDLGITSYSLLTTPFYKLKTSNKFEKKGFFSEYLRSLGLEIAMHGYSHQTKSGSNAEFSKMPSDRMRLRLKQGLTLIRNAFSETPVGFIPPLWIAPNGLTKIAKEAGFAYCAIVDIVHNLRDGTKHDTSYNIISQGLDFTTYTNATLETELGGPLQIGIHPLDILNNQLLDFLADLKDRLGYNFLSYGDYLFPS